MPAQTERQPLFKDMTAEQLGDAYWHHRNAGARWAEMAAVPFGRWQRGRISGSVFYHQDRLELIVRIADKRGIDLLEGA